MEINKKLLKKLEALSALSLSDKEKKEMEQYLKKTLSHFEKIKAIDTKDTPALVSPFEPPLVTRKDEPKDFEDKEELLKEAPQKQGALVKVPPTV